ncbi:hypothetical protein WG66_008777 [Moniliophthora roreri]|nr:hypothetical protein WG66_008777 [Moniliophthora roreri]
MPGRFSAELDACFERRAITDCRVSATITPVPSFTISVVKNIIVSFAHHHLRASVAIFTGARGQKVISGAGSNRRDFVLIRSRFYNTPRARPPSVYILRKRMVSLHLTLSYSSPRLSLVEARNDEKPRERVNSLSNTRHPILILFGVSLLKASDVEKLREESSHTHHPSPYLLERHGTVIERTQTFARLMMTSTFS